MHGTVRAALWLSLCERLISKQTQVAKLTESFLLF